MLYRLERVNLKSKSGITKVAGTLVCLAGAMLLSFYQGIALTNTSHKTSAPNEDSGHSVRGKWILGTVALFAAIFSWSSWFLLQTKVSEKYPALYSGTAIVFFFSFLQVLVLSLTTERGLSIWGIIGSGVGLLVMSWCVEKRGPVFAAAFSPLIQITVAVIGVSIVHEQLFLGSILGSVLVVVGLYFLLWGKSEDVRNTEVMPSLQKTEDIQELFPTQTA
ncbi:WAT1-related protein At3g30340-like [Asparagus officinalis]|uniref:WAT1-related protein At3g30340-like n=1 Tax=Asparagus officinalis TaxID=4686 RepID=UPI00098E14CD|nr:WAT1-related protein At3g30340-like [Asparagus officinalis]